MPPAPIGPVPTRPAMDRPATRSVPQRPAAGPGTAQGGAPRRWRAGGVLAGETAVLAMLAAAKLALHLATAARYGYHRDELYYLAAGHHLMLGYPDFPPVTPALARLAELAFGGSLVGLRLVPAVAGAAIVVLAGLFARELGGGRAAVALAGLAALVCPMLVGANLMLQTVTFDQLAWMTCLYLLARLLRTGDRWLWIPLGVAFGIGLETKYTILVLGFGIAVGVLATPVRRQLRTPWPWLAGVIAAALLAPNLAWQATHGWPTLEFLRHHDADLAAENSPVRFAAENLLLVGVLVVPVWVAGLVRLYRDARFRLLGWTAVTVVVAMLALHAKSYYAGPLHPALLAAGMVTVEQALRRRRRSWLAPALTAAVLLDLVALPLGLPVLPRQTMERWHLTEARKDYADMLGWPELAATVAGVYHTLPPAVQAHTTILAANYGEAGAIDRFGGPLGLPAAASGHNGYWFWLPHRPAGGTVIAVGYDPARLAPYCTQVGQVATLDNADHVRNEEHGKPVSLCRHTRVPVRDWPFVRRFG